MKREKKLRGSSQKMAPVPVAAKTEFERTPHVALETLINDVEQNLELTDANAPEREDSL